MVAARQSLYRQLSDALFRAWTVGVRPRTCPVCVEERAPDRFLAATTRCAHPPRSCAVCLQAWTAAQLDDAGWNRLRCPDCDQALHRADVRAVAARDTYERYKKLAERARLTAHPDWHWCLAPGCDAGQIHPASSGPRFVCRKCGLHSCIRHGERWHSGLTCDQRDNRDKAAKIREEEASERWKAIQTKKCGGCGVAVIKNGGCDSMYCTQCHNSWDWGKARRYKAQKIDLDENSPPKHRSPFRFSFGLGASNRASR